MLQEEPYRLHNVDYLVGVHPRLSLYSCLDGGGCFRCTKKIGQAILRTLVLRLFGSLPNHSARHLFLPQLFGPSINFVIFADLFHQYPVIVKSPAAVHDVHDQMLYCNLENTDTYLVGVLLTVPQVVLK